MEGQTPMLESEIPRSSTVVEQEEIQKRTFTNWINAQLSKRCPPTAVSDLFSDIKDGARLLDLLEVMSGQCMKREKGRSLFQKRCNIETALNFLRNKSIKLVNINVSDIIDGRPSIILGLIWTIILYCRIEVLTSSLSFRSHHGSIDSLSSVDSFSSSPALGGVAPDSPTLRGGASRLHTAKKALLIWVKDQCQRAGCSVSVKDFKSSWRSGEAFLALLCSLRPHLVDLSLARTRSNKHNLEEAFRLAEKELHIPRLLEPQDVDVKRPDEKSIMTYVAQFLQYSNDRRSPDNHLQDVSSESNSEGVSPQLVLALTQEATWLLREPLQVSSVPLKICRERIQLLSKKMTEVDLSRLLSSAEFKACDIERLQQTVPEICHKLTEVEKTCKELQQASTLLERHLAELSHWGTEALESYQSLKKRQHVGHSGPRTRIKFLISRGLQLEGQVVAEGQDLQALVDNAQNLSLSTSTIHDRVSKTVSHSQEIMELLSSLAFSQRVPPGNHPPTKIMCQTGPDTKVELVGLTDTGDVQQTNGTIDHKSQDPSKPQSSFQKQGQLNYNHSRDKNVQKSRNKVLPHVEIQVEPPHLAKMSDPQIPSPLDQNRKEAKCLSQPQSSARTHVHISNPSQTEQHPCTGSEPIDKAESPNLSKSTRDKKEPSSHSQTHGQKLRLRRQQNLLQTECGNQKPPLPPALVRGDVHAKAQAVAKNRLEKAKYRLQENIQEAIILFSDKEISEWQAKRKQRALRTLKKALLEEFLGAVEGFSFFCSETELQDLMLLSVSVRKQWEDVHSEMANFVPLLWSQIRRRGKNQLSQKEFEMHAYTLHDTADQIDFEYVQQTCLSTDGGDSLGSKESHQETCPAVAQLRESSGRQETPAQTLQSNGSSHSVLPQQDGGQQSTPLSRGGTQADPQPTDNSQQKPSPACPDQDPIPGLPQASDCPLHVKNPTQDGPPLDEDHQKLTLGQKLLPGKDLDDEQESLLQTQDQHRLKVHSGAPHSPQSPAQLQAVVRGDVVETRRAAERTVIPPEVPPQQEEGLLQQEVLRRYQDSSLAFHSKLERNRQLLQTAETIPDPVSVSTLQNQLQNLQTLKQETEELWFEFELQYAQLSQFAYLLEDKGGVERDRTQLLQQWRSQQICLQNRMASCDTTIDLMEASDCQMKLITEQLDHISREPVDISSLSLADSKAVNDLKEMDLRLEAEMSKLSGKAAEEEKEGLDATTPSLLGHAIHSRFPRLRHLREHLKKVESALHALDCFLAGVRQGQAEIQALGEPSSRQGDEVVQVSPSWQAAARQRFQMAGEDAVRVDGLLKATGMTLTMDGATVTCEDVVASLVQRLDEMSGELSRSTEDQNKELCVSGRSQEVRVGSKVKLNGLNQESGLIKTDISRDCSGQGQTQEENPHSHSGLELGSGLEPERCKSGEQDKETKELEKEEVPRQEEAEDRGGRRRAQEQSSGSKDQRRRRRRSSQGKKEGEETKSAVQRRFTFLRLLREIQGATGELGLKEPTLHAVQQRMRALTELESRLAGQRSELLYLLDASSQSAATADVTNMNEMEALFDETQTVVTERLDQCRVLEELLKRFQAVGSELSSTLQRAEKAISEQASYMGKDNLQRLHDKVQDSKAELHVLGGRIEDVRNICRQLQCHLKQIPECTTVTFEGEADTLMDRWLDVTERTDSHLDNLHRGLALWEGLLQLGRDVESWAANKMEAFAQTPPFQTDEEVITFQVPLEMETFKWDLIHKRLRELCSRPSHLSLVNQTLLSGIRRQEEPGLQGYSHLATWNELLAQEESVERFHRRAAEIQSLLLSPEPPLELQVVESQMKKWMEEVKELFSEAEDVYRQLAAAKGQVLTRMAECQRTLQQMQDSLANLSPSDVLTARSQIQALCVQMERQEEEAEGLLEDLSLMARLAGPESLRHLAEEGMRLQEGVGVTRQLLSQAEKQIDRDVEALNSALKAEPELASSYLSQRREAHNKMETLQQQTAQLPTLFPWPGGGERRQATRQAQDLLEEAKSLGLSFATLAEQGKELAQRTNDPIWEDSSWAALMTCQSTLEAQLNGVCLRLEQGTYEEEHCGRLLQDCYSVVTSLQERMSTLDTQQQGSAGDYISLKPLEALLQEMGNAEKDFLHIVSLKDSLLASSTAEAQAVISKQVSTLQTQKVVLENSIKEKLAWVKENMAPGDHRFRDNTSCLQEELKELADSLAKLDENDDMIGDINRLKQQWDVIKDYESNLKELAAKLSHLQNPGGSKVSEEMLPADGTLTAGALAKEHDSILSYILQKKQETAENIANGVREAISQLEQWNQMVKSSTSKPTQADVDIGLQLQQAVQWVISQREFLVSCLGKKRTKKLQKGASDALCKRADVTPRVVNQEADGGVEPVLKAQPVCVPVSADVDADVELTDISELESNTQEAETRTKVTAHSYDGDKCSDDSKASSNKVLTIVLEVPQCQPEDVKQGESCGECLEKNSTHSLSNNSRCRTLATTTDGESNKAVQKSKESRLTEIKFTGSQIHTCTEVKSHLCKSPESAGSDGLMIPKSDGRVTASELTDTDPAGSVHAVTCPGITSEAMTDFCHIKDKLAESSVMCAVDGPGQTMLKGDSLVQTQLLCTHSTGVSATQQDMATDALQTESMHVVDTGMEDKAYADNSADTECIDTANNHTPGEIQDNLKFPEAGGEPELHAALEVASTEGTQEENQEGVEAEGRTAGAMSDSEAGVRAGGSTESSKQQSSIMLGILSEIQGLVEKSNITSRAEHMDGSWYLECSPREAEIQLERAMMRVMRCRYQPAQLSVAAMTTQLQEAEEHKRCVLDQVAAMKLMGTRVHDPAVLRNMEEQCSAALLDASATVQVKAAQQEQVTHYHKQMKAIRVLLEVLAAEMEKLNLDALGSSALQAGRLHVLLLTMEQKKGSMAELLRSCSQLASQLTDAESSGALLAQLGDVQEEWRLLEGSAKRALRHATVAASQASHLLEEAEDLQARLNVIPSLLQSTKITHQIEITTDLKTHQHRYLQLQSQLNALEHFSLGRKEKEVINGVLKGMRPMLELITNQLDTYLQLSMVIPSLAKITKQLNELVVWAKQAENHNTFRKTLALFPEEARIQIAEMRKFHIDILSRRSKMRSDVEEIKAMTSDLDQEESHQVCISLKMVEELYATIAQSSVHALEVMEKDLEQREKLLSQLASTEAWLAEAHMKRDPCVHIEKASKADVKDLESRLRMHKLATEETECQLNLVEALAEISKEMAITLNPAESHYLINRLSGLWTELDGMAAHERATSWELEELVHERTSSDEELATVQTSLKQISIDLNHQRFPLTKDTLSSIVLLKHMLMEHQCQVQSLQHCEEAKRSSLLCTIEDLQERCKALYSQTLEQDKYVHLQKQMETSRDSAQKRLQHAKDKTVTLGERFRLCQMLLVELPLVKTQCQEAADQLEAIAPDLYPSQLHSERHSIRSTVETLVSWEHAITADIRNLESKLIQGLHFHAELRALMEIFQSTRQELEAAEAVCPDEKAIDIALRRCWVIWRNLESGMRVLEALGRKGKIQLMKNVELYNLRDATMQASHSRMESLSQAREALKDYLWAAQGAIAFLYNAEATFLSARGGFSDCSEEQRQTQEALASLEDSLGAHIRHLVELVPLQCCLSRPQTEQLHIGILSQLLVGRATLEAQAQLRLEALQRCAARNCSHRKSHEDIRQLISRCEAQLSECGTDHVTSYDECVEQQNQATSLMTELRGLTQMLEKLGAGCPVQGCGVGKDGELGALWRRWASLRRGVGLLLAHSVQRGEEWKDIATSMEQCSSSLASLRAELPDSSAETSSSAAQGEPHELLAHTQMLEQEQQALASLEHRLEHVLSLSSPPDVASLGPVAEKLEEIQENFRSLKERNVQVMMAAHTAETERQRVQEEIGEVENRVADMLPSVEQPRLSPRQQQEVRKGLSSNKAELQRIMDSVQSRFSEVPADISCRIQEVQLSLQRAEEKFLEGSGPLCKLANRVVEVHSGLEGVKALLEQRNPTLAEAQHTIKRVWDELDTWHSRLSVLESEAQDLAEDEPEQAHLLMDRLTQPLQLYQDTANMVEQRTAFLSKIPAYLQGFEDMLHSAICWIEEAQSWVSSPCTYSSAKSLQRHAQSLQMVLEDAERIRAALEDFRPLLREISAVCDTSNQEERLAQADQQVDTMQYNITEPLEQLMHAAAEVNAMETELKAMEKNVSKIQTIFTSMDSSNLPPEEHLRNLQVILANLQSMHRTLEEMERCRRELGLPQGAETSLAVFPRAKLLLQPLQELEQLAQQHAALLEVDVGQENETEEMLCSEDVMFTAAEVSNMSRDTEELQRSPHGSSSQLSLMQGAFEVCDSEEEDEQKDEDSPHSVSSDDTLTCSIPEDPEDTLRDHVSDAQCRGESESMSESELQPLSEVKAQSEHKDLTARHGGSGEEQQAHDTTDTQMRWSQLYGHVSQKLATLRKVQEEHEAMFISTGEVSEKEMEMFGSGAAVLYEAQDSTASLQQLIHSMATEVSCGPVEKEVYQALRRVLLCLDRTTDFLLTPVGTAPDDYQLRSLQQECLWTELETLGETLGRVEAEIRPGLLAEEPDSLRCVTSLQQCLQTAQSVLNSSQKHLHTHLGLAHQHQAGLEHVKNQVCVFEHMDLGQTDLMKDIKESPNVEHVLSGGVRESPQEKAQLQQSSRALLQGLASLLDLAEESLGTYTAEQARVLPSPGQVQPFLCRRKKLFQVLGSQAAFLRHLFQHQPGVVESLEAERMQLEHRTNALHQGVLQCEVSSQTRLQDWSQWERDRGQLGQLLDQLETLISGREPEGDDHDDVCPQAQIQERQDTCQRVLDQLEQSRHVLGSLLDLGNTLQRDAGCSTSASQAGGALELRWRSIHRRTEHKIRRCQDLRDSWSRFQGDSESLDKWLLEAHTRLQTLSGVVDGATQNQEHIPSCVIQLLDLSMEVEGRSAQKTSVARAGTHLNKANCPEMSNRLDLIELSWSKLISGRSKALDKQQQLLLARWPPVGLLSELESWLNKLNTILNQERESVLQARDADQLFQMLQHCQEMKVGMVNGQLVLDFLCQCGPQMAVGHIHSERTLYAERLGHLHLCWQQLQAEHDCQIREVEQMHRTCTGRERRLGRLRGWVTRETERLSKRRHPVSQTLAHKALLEWKANEERAKEVALALQELHATRVFVQEEGPGEGEHPSDAAFMKQVESVSQACRALQQEVEVLRPALQRTLEAWRGFDQELSEILRHTTRVRCTLQLQCNSLYSHKQAEAYVEQLQQVQEKASEGEELCAAVDQSYQRLRNTVDPGTAQLLNKRMEGEKTRWTSVVQEVNQELLRAREVLSLWNGYIQLSDHCSLHLQQLRSQWEALARSQITPPHDTQSELDAVEKLQDDILDLQSSMGNMSTTSKLLIGQLEPLPASAIQSKTILLSRDVLLLGQTLSGAKAHLQEDLAQHKTFCTSLEALEQQAQNILHRLPTSLSEITSVKKLVPELNDVFPSLVDLSVMSCSVRPTEHQADRLQALKRDWLQGLLHVSHINRELQKKIQHSQSFQEKSENLKALQDKLEVDLVDRRCESYSSLKEMLTLHQRYQSDIMTGYQLLQGHLCEAVFSLDNLTEEQRSERMAGVARVKESWQSCVALVEQRKALVQEQFSQWSCYNHALKRLQRLLSNIDPLLPPAGPAVYTLQQLRTSVDSYQRLEETLGLHATAYNQTLEAGERLRASMTKPQSQKRLEEELQALQDKWENTCTRLERRRDLVNTVIQDWVKCQGGLALRTQQLNQLKSCMKEPQPGRPDDLLQDEEELLQEKELSLEHLASGLRELATMRMDLSQYVAAGDTALLEQQLEQLHCQWEELCMKVSVRRQEIADRLNAWTIFNDKNRELCDWLMQIERKVSHSGDLSIEEMVEKLKKDCMEEINLFSENKTHLKQLGEQLLLASDETKQRQVRGTLQEVNQRWNNLFQHIEARVRKLKDTLVTVQQLDKNMSNLRCWLSRVEAELSRPITYSVCHHGEIQRRLAEQQELQRDIEQHTEGVASVLSLCDVLLRDEDAAGGTETEGDSLQETSRSLDQRWRAICTMALDRRLRIEETWRMWCKFLDDYSRFEDWLKMAERTAANPNSADVLYTVAKEELKKFEGFQRQVHERLTQLELVNTQYRRLTVENRTDRASQLKAMVHQGNRRWDTLHRRVAAVLRRLKHFTSQREDFEGTRESMLVWLTELDLKLTNVEHFSESDVHCKMQQLNGFQKEIALNTERIDGLIVFGEGLIQRSCPLDAVLIEEELEELHSYCQEVFGRLVRFHQRLSQPQSVKEEPELFGSSASLEGSLELIRRPWLGRGHGSLPATPIHLLTSPLERSGTPASVDSLPLEWDHTGDVGGSSSHEDDEDEQDEDGSYFSALSEGEGSESQEEEDFVEASEGPALGASSLVSSRSMSIPESPKWQSLGDSVSEAGPQLDSEAQPTRTSTPIKQGYLRLMSECSGSIEDIKRVSLILDDEEQPEEPGLTGLNTTDKQSGVIERWELLQAQSRGHMLHHGPREPQQVDSDLADITSWLAGVIPELEKLQHCDPAASIQDMEARVKQMKETQKTFARYKSTMLSVNLAAQELQGQSSLEDKERKESLASVNQAWSQACTCLEERENGLRRTLMRCQEFHETLHSLLLWLAHAESSRDALALQQPDSLHHKHNTLTALHKELQSRQAELDSLQALWSELQPEEGTEDIGEAREKLHVTGNKLRLLRRQVAQDLGALPKSLDYETSSPSAPEGHNQAQVPTAASAQQDAHSTKGHNSQRERRRDPSPPRSFFQRVLRAAFPLHLLLLLLLLLVCLVPLPDSEPGCTLANNFKRSFYPMLRYTNGPPPT